MATATLTAAGLMAAPPGAARGCLWQVPETLPLRQDNGLTVIIHTSNYTGRVQYAHTDGDDWTHGVTDGNGGLNSDGYMFYVKVDWNAGPGAGFSNSWPGRIGDDSSFVGTTTNNIGTVNNWQAWAPVFCTEPRTPFWSRSPGRPSASHNP